ncbi:MAG: class IV adenylate cyclase [Candidatus Nezhaarchaeales archaeon]
MIEVEVKVVLSEKEKQEVLKRLREACSSEKVYEEEDIFFISTHDPLLGVDKTLKLRKSDGEIKLVFKQRRPNRELKESLEFEVRVREEDVNNLVQLLRCLGFKESLVIKKKRRSFYLSECTINIDDVEGLGSFLEIEVLANEVEEGNVLNKILETLSALGLSEKKLIHRGYAEMFHIMTCSNTTL